MPSEDDVVVSMPTDFPGAPGSERDECVECGCEVWVSPATRQSIDEGIYPETIVCINCAPGVGDD